MPPDLIDDSVDNVDDAPITPVVPAAVEPTTEEKLKAMVDEELKGIKSKLDVAFEARDKALARVAELEQSAKEAERERLKSEGKEKGAMELELAEERAKRETLEKRNVELTRNIDVNSELAKYEFKSERARKMAFNEVTSELVQDEKGLWSHKTGESIPDFIKKYTENADNAFLLKQKASNGAGLDTPRPSDVKTQPKSLFEMTQAEVMKLASEGKLSRK